MDNVEEAKKWFRNIMKGCYLKKLDKYPDIIFWVYDKNLIRQRKLSKITGIEKFNLVMKDGEWIFEENEKNGYFYIKYSGYWKFLESNFNLDTEQVRKLTTDVVNEILNCKQYSTSMKAHTYHLSVNEILNCKQYSTAVNGLYNHQKVNEILNCKQYSTGINWGSDTSFVNEILNSNQYKI